MPQLNIIVCNDQRCRDFNGVLLEAKNKGQVETQQLRAQLSEEVNIDGPLCRLLREQGHKVVNFDGRDEVDRLTTIDDSRILANMIANLIIANSATAMILDLNFFGNFKAGVEIMRHLIRDHSIPIDMKQRLIIYSNFLNQPEFNYAHILTVECGIPKENLLTRTMVDIYTVAKRFEGWRNAP